MADSTRAMRSVLAMQNALQPFSQWRALTGVSDLQRSLRAVSEMNERLTGWSRAVTAMSMAVPDLGELGSALAMPTGELRSLADVADDLGDDTKRSLADLAAAVDEADQPGSPHLLSDWLRWLPSTAQARLLILVLVALNALIEYADVEARIEQQDHLTTLIYAIAAVATVLNEYVAKGQ
jgi:hypothetical protein